MGWKEIKIYDAFVMNGFENNKLINKVNHRKIFTEKVIAVNQALLIL